jgi:hypothetical protein
MRKTFLIFALFIFAIINANEAQGATLPERLSGRILLQVEENGEAWYVYPVNRLRYYLGRPDDAFRIMRELGLGISERDYDNFRENPPARLLGRIMIRAHMNGEAYYVDPLTRRFIYLGRPADAFQIMREKGLGVSNFNLSRMPISGNSTIPPGGIMNITVNQPLWNARITSPITVSGEARVRNNTLNIRLRNANNAIIANAAATAQPSPEGMPGPYSVNVSFSSPGTASGFFEIFDIAADGTEIDKVITLVRF